jgi:hypothetical protein
MKIVLAAGEVIKAVQTEASDPEVKSFITGEINKRKKDQQLKATKAR